ncbi:MAG TPA: hydrogenase expression/formation protein HypE [Bacteroidetes bacterium]|nr:hydrogenase expression/formation protein HypE [Bacteroidota bacterium]
MKKNTILLAHGSGGKMSHDLIREIFMKYFSNSTLEAETDSAILEGKPGWFAFTTDSYVVSPLFFAGGDIGALAVCGTINDLSVSGAQPVAISASFILEEGLPMEVLERIVRSMAGASVKAGVPVVTGDTKVVEHGKCDQVFINTAGVGWIKPEYRDISYGNKIRPGDKIILNGPVGDHGVAILAARESLDISSDIRTDSAPLNALIRSVLDAGIEVHFMRDPTRGGLATVLCEIAEKNKLGIDIREKEVPVKETVKNICEVFGYDPLYLANEGKVVMVVPGEQADKAVGIIRSHNFGKEACVIGEVTHNHPGKVVMQTEIGGSRIVDMLAGEQLPRIC